MDPEGDTAVARLGQEVAATRRQTAAGVDDAEYQTTLSVLERIARNLGWVDPGGA